MIAKLKKPELMAPAGDETMLVAAIKNGADAVYFGIEELNMRAKAANFTLEGLRNTVDYCKEHSVKTYLVLNTIVKEGEVSLLDSILEGAKAAGVDMIICWDFSVIDKCLQYDIPVCISTQASLSNSSAVNLFSRMGVKRIVPARECSLEDLIEIRKNTNVEIEVFVHGAMCVAVSGRCFLSQELFNKSANQGECVQPCRRLYDIYDSTTGKSLKVGSDYILSAKDLCALPFLDKLIEAGFDSFKIEGRKRSPEYVAKVVSVYRRAIDSYFEGKFDSKLKSELLEELKEVYNRGMSDGFFLDIPTEADFAGADGSLSTTVKEYTAKVLDYYKKAGAAHIKIETGEINLGDRLLIIGKTSGVIEFQLESIRIDETVLEKAVRGNFVTIKVPETVRANDKVYIIKQRQM